MGLFEKPFGFIQPTFAFWTVFSRVGLRAFFKLTQNFFLARG
jgi:hypothetical protein